MEQVRPPYMQNIRQKLINSKMLELSANILTKSWQPQTTKRYQPNIEKRIKFSCKGNTDPICLPKNLVLKFLTWNFRTGVGYSSISTTCSALSSLIEPVNSWTLGKQPLLRRIWKEFLICPVFPCTSKYF